MQYYHHLNPKNHSQIGYHYHIGNLSSCEPHKPHKPPINCTESDIRWIWRKKLEERQGHYVDSKKSRKFYVTRILDSNDKQIVNLEQSQQRIYCGTHHLRRCMKNTGLIFKRNAFSTIPLHIGYNNFETEIYIKRIANTNFSEAFRPGSYGKIMNY